MEGMVQAIQALSGTDADLQSLQKQLKENATLLSNNANSILPAATGLDYAQHSLGALVLLETFSRVATPAQLDANFIDIVASFFTSCQAKQVQMASEQFVKLGRKFREAVVAGNCPRKGILPLRAAVAAVQPSPEHLTPLHAECFMLCLLSKCYNAAVPLLSQDIYFVEPPKTHCTPRDLYLYCRYGSLLCIGRKQWSRAAELCLVGLTAPSLVSNAIVLDCYKTHVLVGLIWQGQQVALPKTVSMSVRSLVESDARPYNELATAYGTHKPEKVRKVVEHHQATFNNDGNLGLVLQVVDSLVRRNIQRLTSTYLTLPLSDIAREVGLASGDKAEQHLLTMIQSGDLFASISDREGGMVTFSEDPQTYTTAAATNTLSKAVADSMALAERLAHVQHNLACSREYIKKTAGKGGGASSKAAAAALGAEPDESLMDTLMMSAAARMGSNAAAGNA